MVSATFGDEMWSARGVGKYRLEKSIAVRQGMTISFVVENRDDFSEKRMRELAEAQRKEDADIVLFVYREDYYLAMQEPSKPMADSAPSVGQKHDEWSQRIKAVEGLSELIIAKQRHGPTGTVELAFEGQFTRFSDLAEEDRLPERFE